MNSLPSWPACKAQLFLLIVIALAAKNSCVAFEVNGSNRDLARLNDQSVSIFGDKHNQRLLQQQQPSLFSFRAQYRAQFHQWIDPECEESSPLIRVACRGSYITIQNKSHPSIVCGTTVQQDDDNWSYLECKNTCTSNEECSEVYLAIGGIIADGNFGEISFQCESNDFEEVEAAVYWNASSGSCSSDPGLADPVSTIWHFLRLGIFCPVTQETESTIVYYNRSDYIYDDYFFECWFGRLIDFFEPHHFYTCFGGETCFEHDCVYDTIDEFAVRATLPAFQSQCIEPGVPVTNIATSSPETPTVQFLPYTSARFEARWGILVQSTCSTSSPMVRISCLNGEISDVSPTVKSISCTDFSSGVIDCVDSDLASGEDKFTGVTYVCTSAVDPTTSIEFPTSAAFCDGNIINGTVSHAAQLGVFCLENGNLFSEVVGQEVAYFWDLFSECGDQYHEVVNLNELGSDVSNTTRFTCVKSATFPVGSSPSDTNVIPRVSVTTDRRWGSSLTFRSCVEATNSVPSFPTTPSPKISPNPTGTPLTISPPTLMSTIAPGAQIPTVTIGQPLSSPSSMIPVVNGTVSSAGRSVTGSSNALTIGSAFIGAVGVLLVAGLIIFIIFRRSSHDTRNANDVSIELHNEVDVSIELYNEVDMLSSNVSTEGVGSSWTNPKMEHPSRSLQFKDQAQDVRKGPTSNPRVKVASIQDRPLADVFRRKEEQHLRSSINNADRHRGLDP